MAKYTTRTCTECGIRDIQPNMVQKTIRVQSGTSNTGLSGRTVVGTLLGSDKSGKQMAKWLTAPNKRVYYRNKTVWLCEGCAPSSKTSSDGPGWLGSTILAAIGLGVYALFGGFDEDPAEKSKQAVEVVEDRRANATFNPTTSNTAASEDIPPTQRPSAAPAQSIRPKARTDR